MVATKVGEIYATEDGEGMIIWNSEHDELISDGSVYSIDVMQDILVEVDDKLDDARNIYREKNNRERGEVA
tara:strand:- start:266 stop:478 length:213 start_codon:yes stop_codon:yes gene_type:complete